jgi:hypothetical protein
MYIISGKEELKIVIEEITNNVNYFCALGCIYYSSPSCSGCGNSFIEDVHSF